MIARIRRKVSAILNRILPNRPNLEDQAFASFKAKFLGNARNILVKSGGAILERAWISCTGSNAHITIGRNTCINPYAKLVTDKGFIEIGDNCSIHSFCVLYGFGGLKIGNNCRIATQTVMVSANHRFDDPTRDIHGQGSDMQGIVIGNDVWIGAGAKILDGVVIGDHVVIAAGSVVSRDVPSNYIAAGVPAKLIRKRGEKRRPTENLNVPTDISG